MSRQHTLFHRLTRIDWNSLEPGPIGPLAGRTDFRRQPLQAWKKNNGKWFKRSSQSREWSALTRHSSCDLRISSNCLLGWKFKSNDWVRTSPEWEELTQHVVSEAPASVSLLWTSLGRLVLSRNRIWTQAWTTRHFQFFFSSKTKKRNSVFLRFFLAGQLFQFIVVAKNSKKKTMISEFKLIVVKLTEKRFNYNGFIRFTKRRTKAISSGRCGGGTGLYLWVLRARETNLSLKRQIKSEMIILKVTVSTAASAYLCAASALEQHPCALVWVLTWTKEEIFVLTRTAIWC